MIPNARLTSRKDAASIRGFYRLACLLLPLLVIGCSQHRPDVIDVVVTNPNAYQENHGPFDKNGNYVESWADNPPKRRYISLEQYQRENMVKTGVDNIASTYKNIKKQVTHTNQRPQPQQPAIASYQQQPIETQRYRAPEPKVQPAPKPKPVKVTPKKKPSITHTVKKGDTLYGLSRKYGASVSVIQKANGISGSNIRIGQKLTIPR